MFPADARAEAAGFVSFVSFLPGAPSHTWGRGRGERGGGQLQLAPCCATENTVAAAAVCTADDVAVADVAAVGTVCVGNGRV